MEVFICTSYGILSFGLPSQSTGGAAAGSTSQPIQWSSEFYDSELGLVYYNYRHYNPEDGRWLRRDDISNEKILNLYSYVYNKSNEIDIIGLSPDVQDIIQQTGDFTVIDCEGRVKESWCDKFARAMAMLVRDSSFEDYDDFTDYFHGEGKANSIAGKLALKMNEQTIAKSSKLYPRDSSIKKQIVGLKDNFLANGQQTARHFAGALYAGPILSTLYGFYVDGSESLIRDEYSDRWYEVLAEYAADMVGAMVAFRIIRKLNNHTPVWAIPIYYDAAWAAVKYDLSELWRDYYCR